MIELHSQQEDLVLYPVLDSKIGQAVASFTLDHRSSRDLMTQMRAIAQKMRNRASYDAEKRELTQTLLTFVVQERHHMWKEEQVLSPLMEKYLTDEEKLTVARNILEIEPTRERMVPWIAKNVDQAQGLIASESIKLSMGQHK